MRYMGSKNRLAKEILPIILFNRKQNQWYVEPFVGGCNLITKVDGNRIGNDIHYYLIEMFKKIQNNWNPPDYISKDTYIEIKNNKEKYPPHLVGFVGFGCSYSGKWFGGYASNSGKPRNYACESKRNILNQIDSLKEIIFTNVNYYDMIIPENSIIYCDPPYEGTTKYKDSFDHKSFWEWCRNKHGQGHKIFISEYNAPEDFECIWNKKVNNSLTKDTGSKKGIEKLWTFK